MINVRLFCALAQKNKLSILLKNIGPMRYALGRVRGLLCIIIYVQPHLGIILQSHINTKKSMVTRVNWVGG